MLEDELALPYKVKVTSGVALECLWAHVLLLSVLNLQVDSSERHPS